MSQFYPKQYAYEMVFTDFYLGLLDVAEIVAGQVAVDAVNIDLDHCIISRTLV
jgi:hypothetical protein